MVLSSALGFLRAAETRAIDLVVGRSGVGNPQIRRKGRMTSVTYQRREMLQLAGATAVGSILGGVTETRAAEAKPVDKMKGCIVGQPEAARAGEGVLAAGG